MLPLRDASVDACVTDPPYGTQERMDGYGRSKKTIANDCSLDVFRDALPEMWRVLKPGGMLAVWMAPTEAWEAEGFIRAVGFTMWGSVVWDKGVPAMGYRIRYAHEAVLLAGKDAEAPIGGLISLQRAYPPSRLPSATGHPHEKPVSVCAALIRWGVPTDGLVLDCFYGSGTTGVACAQEGRRFIGIELNESYVEIAKRRIASAPLNLFASNRELLKVKLCEQI